MQFRSPTRILFPLRVLGVVAIVATIGACGSTNDSTSRADEVASIDSAPASGDNATDTSTPTSVDPEQAFVNYTACMREHGIDLPDPQVVSVDEGSAGDGGVVVAQGPAIGVTGGGTSGSLPFDPSSDEYQAAEAECQPILDDVFGEIEIDPEVLAEQREQMLDFAQCMRDHGIDFADPTFTDGGNGISIQIGSAGDDANPPTDGPGSEEFDAASEACGGIFGDGSTGIFTAANGVEE
ncbi:MAG: hypothetical protein K8R99_10545 [Actinomycetia bacterium]|nr:hypothetical protein [Actinomycetes bacterium]